MTTKLLQVIGVLAVGGLVAGACSELGWQLDGHRRNDG